MDNNFNSLFYILLSAKNTNSDNNMSLFVTLFVLALHFISNILRNVNLYDVLIDYIHQKNNYIIKNISSHSIPTTKPFQSTPVFKNIYSDTFLALINYVKSLEHIELNTIEIISKELLKYDTNTYDNKNELIYTSLIYTSSKILIDDENNIYFQLTEINNDDDNKSNSNTPKVVKDKQYMITLSVLKNTKHNSMKLLNDFEKKCLKLYHEKLDMESDNDKLYIFTYLGCEKTDGILQFHFSKTINDSSVDLDKNIFFEGHTEYCKYIKDFIYDNDTKKGTGYLKYKELGDKYVGSALLYGKPGCGKTSTIKATPLYLKRHLILFRLQQFKTNEEMEEFFFNTTFCGIKYSRHQLCLCSEDIDACKDNLLLSRQSYDNGSKHNNDIDIKQNISEGTGENLLTKVIEGMTCSTNKNDDAPTLQTFLNITDGVKELTGIFLIFTTNHFEKLDEAVVRDGRIDYKINFKMANKNIMKKILKHRFNVDDIDKYFENKNIIDYILSIATVISICKKHNTSIFNCITGLENECKDFIKKLEH